MRSLGADAVGCWLSFIDEASAEVPLGVAFGCGR